MEKITFINSNNKTNKSKKPFALIVKSVLLKYSLIFFSEQSEGYSVIQKAVLGLCRIKAEEKKNYMPMVPESPEKFKKY